MNTPDLFKMEELVAGNTKTVMSDIKAGRRDVYMVPLDKISFIDGFNVREDSPEYLAHIESIAQSILANGFYSHKPIAVFVDEHGNIKVRDGHSRYRGAKRAVELGAAGLEALPCVVSPRGTTLEDMTVELVTSNSGKPLTPYETGIVVKRLIGMGLDEKTISKRLGIGVAYINDLLTLVGAPKAIREMVIQEQVSATTAIKEVNTHGGKAAARLTKALSTAKAAGKTKVTGKHLEKPKARFKSTVAGVQMMANGRMKITIVIEPPEGGVKATDEVKVLVRPGDTVNLIVTPQKEEEL